jgi:hypothetical protein
MPPEKSGFNYSNKFARIYLEAFREVMSTEEMVALLQAADLPRLANYLPPDNLEKSFDFTYMTAIRFAFTEVFGTEKGDELAIASGRASFAGGLQRFGELLLDPDHLSQANSIEDRLAIGLEAMAEITTQFSDQLSRVYPFDEQTYIYTLERCPMCWGRNSDRVMCHIGQGLINQGLNWITGGLEFRVDIEACVATGSEMGRYVVYREPLG